MRHALLALALLMAACGTASPSPAANPRATADAVFAWQATLDRDHPLVGRIWENRGGRFVSARELLDRIGGERRLVLGERHDNPDHHRLQAYVLERLAARGRRPALVLEMIDAGAQPALDRARKAQPGDLDAIASAVGWANSGWPPWPMYRSLFAPAVRGNWPIVGAGLGREQAMQLARQGLGALDPGLAQRFGLDRAPPPAQLEGLRAEMREAHCGMMPEAMLDAMVLVQRTRDARFAQALHDAAERADGAVLITGNGHARTDRGVPALLRTAFDAKSTALALQEVQIGATDPAAYGATYGAERPPFDYVWFTPRATDEDPCEALRKSHPSPGTARATATATLRPALDPG